MKDQSRNQSEGRCENQGKGWHAIATLEPCSTNHGQPAPSGLAPIEILGRLSSAIAGAQSALLSGRLPELETRVIQQLELCRQLQSSLPLISRNAPHTLTAPARSAQQQLRIFSSILYRMQRTLTALRNALQAAPLTYTPPPASGENWGR